MARLVSRLRFIAGEVDEAAAVAVQETANFILTLIRLYVPVDTGWLRDSYKKESVAMLHILIGSMVNYAIFQEYGTSKMAARPHVTPAFLQAEAYFRSELARRLQNLG